MVATEKKLSAAAPVRRGDDQQLLCNLAAECDQVAIVQPSPHDIATCGGCPAQAAELTVKLEAKRGELQQSVRAAEAVRDEVRSQERAPTTAERLMLKAAAEEIRRVGAHLEEIEAAAAHQATEHWHPVFACDAHGRAAGLIA